MKPEKNWDKNSYKNLKNVSIFHLLLFNNYFKALDIHPEADQFVVSDETYDADSSEYVDFANKRILACL